MTEESKNNDNVDEKSEPQNNVLLDFDFSPDWARKPSSEIAFSESKSNSRSSDSRRRPSSKKNDRRPSRTPGRLAPNRSPDRNLGEANRFRRNDSGGRNRPYIEMPPVNIRFLPEQNKLSAIARKIHTTKRAYPLADLAKLVLSSPDSCYLKIETGHDKDAVALYQCKQCRAVGLDRDKMLAHVADEHISDFFEEEAIEAEAPSGTFVCVAKCGLSGVIIGPPNHHSYNKRVKEIHDAKYPNMSIEEYRQKIVTVKDEESIEKWKEESKQQVIYRLKSSTEDEQEVIDKNDAYKHCVSEIAPKLIMRTKSASLPLGIARKLKDPGLQLACSSAWRRENRFPRSLLLALRAALKHMQLYIFKVSGNEYFVTSVKPLPLDSQYTVAEIAEVLTFIGDNDNCKRIDLIKGLRPDHEVDSQEAEKVLTQLHWLVERGHIIEFFDGRLSVAGRKRPVIRSSKSEGGKPIRPVRQAQDGGQKPVRQAQGGSEDGGQKPIRQAQGGSEDGTPDVSAAESKSSSSEAGDAEDKGSSQDS